MRLSIKRWFDWAMSDLFQRSRPRATNQNVLVSFEKAGSVLPGPVVPWNADAVLLELPLRLPPASRARADFSLRFPGRSVIVPDALRKEDEPAHFRLSFRLPVPEDSIHGEILWRNRILAQVTVSVCSQEEYFGSLRAAGGTIAVHIGNHVVAARTFVASQCKGVTSALVLRSPYGLAALSDRRIRAVFRSDRGAEHSVASPLTSTQFGAKETVLVAASVKTPRRAGNYSVTWYIDERDVLTQRFTAVTGARFLQSLRIIDTRFIIADKAGNLRSVHHAPAPGEASRIGPCFVIGSGEQGAAGMLHLQVNAVSGAENPVRFEGSVLVTDGPTEFSPGMMEPTELAGCSGFDLRHKGKTLGTLTVDPVPTALFTSEGGYRQAPEFTWTQKTEDELQNRLGKLLGNGEG